LSKIGLTTTLKNAWTTSRQVNFFWVANFNLKFGENSELIIFVEYMFFLLTKVVKTYTIKYYKEENRRKTWLSQTLKK
ncbi:hypothetical protein, partial [Streptococcus pneumoniae]|uniref:hypothetical protein n=2 Tax=Streptococcus pneumoniae TaxID=1313 RepID=UPI001D17B785